MNIERHKIERMIIQVHATHGSQDVDILLVAGQKPAIEQLQLQNAGVAVNENGAIIVDKHLHTTVDNIWAMGMLLVDLNYLYIVG